MLAWSVGGHTAGKNEFVDAAQHAVIFGDGLDHAAGAGHIDLPHAIAIVNTGASGINDEGEMHHRFRPVRTHQLQQPATGAFLGQVNFLEDRARRGGFGRSDVHADYVKVLQQLKHTESQIA